MKGIEQMIKREKREEFYDYYLSLEYDHKVAACLALFTYGNYRFSNFSIDDLYDTLCKGKEYLPPEEFERRRLEEWEEKAEIAATMVTTQIKELTCGIPDFLPPEEPEEFYATKMCCCDISESYGSTRRSRIIDYGAAVPGAAVAGGFATDEYEPIEEKDARTAAFDPTSTFRMTTNTASAGVVLNQLRSGRRIDRSMVRIEEMLN